jgi:hypothetical protein
LLAENYYSDESEHELRSNSKKIGYFSGSLYMAEAKARGITIDVPAKAVGNEVVLSFSVPLGLKPGIPDPKLMQNEANKVQLLLTRFLKGDEYLGLPGERGTEVLDRTPSHIEYEEPPKLRIFEFSDKADDCRNPCIKHARRRLSIRNLMEINEVKDAGLRVEEAIAAYLYTGPLFQVVCLLPSPLRYDLTP